MTKSKWLVGLVGGIMTVTAAGGSWSLQAPKPSAFGDQSKPVKASVRMLALSSSSRQNFAGNQEIYLADLQVKNGEHVFARVIDQYPGFGLPIRPDLLHDQTVLAMKVTREPECDEPGSKVYLKLGEATVFDGSVVETLASHAAEPIPCFRTLHQTIAVAKK